MKKIVALALAIVLMMPMFTACANTSPAEDLQKEIYSPSTVSAEEAVPEESEADEKTDIPTGMKIGFVYSPESDALSRTYRHSLKYITEAFGCEVIFADMLDPSNEAMIGYYENLIQQGAEGLVMLFPISVAFLQDLENKGIYYTFINTGDPDIQEFLKTAEHYCGSLVSLDSSDPDRGASYVMTTNMLNCLYEAGCRNLVYTGIAAGNTDHDQRYLAWTEFLENHDDVVAVAEYRGAEAASGMSDILASYGNEIDGICVSDSAFPAVAASVVSAGLQEQIKMSSFDMHDIIPDLMKAGTVVGVGGGNTAFFETCFVMLYNKWSGADDILSEDESKCIPIPNLFVINDGAAYEAYETFFTGDLPALTADELKELCSYYNPDTTIQEKNDYMWWLADGENYNLEAIAERHADLVG